MHDSAGKMLLAPTAFLHLIRDKSNLGLSVKWDKKQKD